MPVAKLKYHAGERHMIMKARILLIILMAVTALSAVQAVNIGISPGAAHFNKMLRGGYASRVVTITTSLDGNITASYEVYGEVKDWIHFERADNSFSFSRDNPYKMKVMVRPPADVQNGNYTGSIRITTGHLGSLKGSSGSLVKAAVSLQLRIEIIGEQIVACRAGGFSIPSVEVGYPLEISYTVINDGNVQLRPLVEVDIWDQLQEHLMHSAEFAEDLVLQTEQERITKTVFTQLPIGQYWASISVLECNVAQLITFSVLEKGSIDDDARFISISTTPWVKVGDIVPVNAIFRNQGQRSVFATFKGKVSLDDQVIQVLNSDELQVPMGVEMNYTLFYTPKLPGQHVVTGRFHYNKKLTFEKGTVMNVLPSEEQPFGIPGRIRLIPVAMFIFIIAVIVILAAKIRKQRKRLRRRRKPIRSKI
jgi:hypothetical protein